MQQTGVTLLGTVTSVDSQVANFIISLASLSLTSFLQLCLFKIKEPWYWKRLLRVPGTARRSTQSMIKQISPEHSLEIPMLKLKLQYSGYLM